MLRNIHKAYRIACIAFGKRRVRMVVLAVFCLLAAVLYQNHFDISKTMEDLQNYFVSAQSWLSGAQ